MVVTGNLFLTFKIEINDSKMSLQRQKGSDIFIKL